MLPLMESVLDVSWIAPRKHLGEQSMKPLKDFLTRERKVTAELELHRCRL